MLELASNPTDTDIIRFLIETNGYVTMEPRGGLATVYSRAPQKAPPRREVARSVIEKMAEDKFLTGQLLGSAVYYDLTEEGRRAVATGM